MVLLRIIEALGVMTLAYIVSETSLYFAKKLEQSKKASFLLHLLVYLSFITALLSMFVGLFMYFQKKDVTSLQKTVEDLSILQQNSKERIEILLAENSQLKDDLYHEAYRTEEISFDKGRQQGYVNGYSVGFEDCMDVINLSDEQKHEMMYMARKSGVHRIKTRPNVFTEKKAVEIDGILR